MTDFVRDHIRQHIAGLKEALHFGGQDIYDADAKAHINKCVSQYEQALETRQVADECLAFIPAEGVAMNDSKLGLNEMLGVVVYMISEMIERLKKNRVARLSVFLIAALGVSALIGGAVTYLTNYGPDTAMAMSGGISSPVKIDPASTAMPTATATPETTPTQAIVVLNVPAGEWTEESCTDAGKQMSAEMASFWTSPQGTGCNVLSNGAWIALP